MDTPEIEELRRRVEALENKYESLKESQVRANVQVGRAQLVANAFQRTVRSLGAEIAETHGVSAEHYQRRMESLARWHYDEILRTSGDSHPGITAAIDTRSLDEIPTEDTAPRILSPRS